MVFKRTNSTIKSRPVDPVSVEFNRVLISGLAFVQSAKSIRISGRYDISRAQILFLLVCAEFDPLERKYLRQFGLTDGNLYRYFSELLRRGFVYRPKFGRYELTDQGRRLVAEFWAEYDKRVSNFRW